jgi:hypothetical protein
MITCSALSSWPSLSALHPACARASGTPVVMFAAIDPAPRKINKEKIPDVSLTFLHLTRLESTKRSRAGRQNARNCAAFTPNNFFVFNKYLMIFAPRVQIPLSA